MQRSAMEPAALLIFLLLVIFGHGAKEKPVSLELHIPTVLIFFIRLVKVNVYNVTRKLKKKLNEKGPILG